MINCNLSYKTTTLIGKKLLLIPNILMAEGDWHCLKQPDLSTRHEEIRQISTENFQTNVKVQFPLLVVHFTPL